MQKFVDYDVAAETLRLGKELCVEGARVAM
jgi:hypothetical protein